MPDLFRIISPFLFRPLAAPGAEIYAEILLALFTQAGRHHQPLSRELVMDMVTAIVSNPQAFALTEDAAADDSISTDAAADADMVRVRASAILRYLERCGWLRSESQSDFSQTFILPDYAFRLLRTLGEIAVNEPPPLRGLICAIHDLLQATIRDGNADVRVPEAHRNTLLLINGLRELQHNIGLHITQVLNQYQASDVLQEVFANYRAEIVDRAYHQLRTTDHVSRFRPRVLEATAQLERAEQIEAAARRLYERHETQSIESAIGQLQEQVREIRELFEALDRILEAIDTRHGQFVDAAVRKIELQLMASSTTSGQLHAILTHLLDDKVPVTAEAFSASADPLVNLFQLTLADSDSLATPTRAPVPFNPEPVSAPTLSQEEMLAAQEETLRQLFRAVSRERVRRWASELLRDRQEMLGADIPLSGPEELPLLVYLRAYGDGSLGYRTDDSAEERWIEQNGVGFRDFILRASPTDSKENAP